MLLRNLICRKDQTLIYVFQALHHDENKFHTLSVPKLSAPASDVDWCMIQCAVRTAGAGRSLGASEEFHVSSDREVRPESRIGPQASFPPDILRPY
jgi:hypothetical protein